MYIALLGRQPALSIAELERVYGDVSWFSESTALVNSDDFNVERLGGTQKAGKVILEIPGSRKDWRAVSGKIAQHYSKQWQHYEGKITLGISVYGFNVPTRDIQKTGLIIKGKLKNSTASIRLVPNQEAALSTATSHHNKLGLSPNKVELLVIQGRKSVIVAESTGAQNITALAARDQGRPKRDAFVGMLPPKLAQMLINLTGVPSGRILDPFCGTGVVLQEALLLGYEVYGTDLADKMIDFTEQNLAWLKKTYSLSKADITLHQGDAMDTTWKKPIDAIAAEGYLGQPFSAPPSASKLTEVRGNCNFIIGGFLKNLHTQLSDDAVVVIAVPAWKDKEGYFTHLPLAQNPEKFGFEKVPFTTISPEQLLYFRPDQVVAREILVLKKILK